MIELFIFLFVLQGDSPSEWLESCNTDFIDYPEKLSERNPDIMFCRFAKDLHLNANDVEKLGIEFNWFNYTMQTSKEFVNNWEFYQDNAIKDTLLIWPSISTRDSLPPGMRVQISFNYTGGEGTKTFDERFSISPLCDPPISADGECNLKMTLNASLPDTDTLERIPTSDRPDTLIEKSPLIGFDCPQTRYWNADSQTCDIRWNSMQTLQIMASLLAAVIISTITVIYYLRKRK